MMIATEPAIRFTVAPRRRKPMEITVSQVEDRLHEAICTLAALPDRERKFIFAKQSSWPPTPRQAIDIMALALERVREGKSGFELPPPPRFTPTKEAIDRMDETLDWLTWLSGHELAIITLRAFDVSWVTIGDRIGRMSRHTAQRRHADIVRKVHGHLRAGDAPEIKPRAADAVATRHLRRMTQRMFR